MPAWPFPLRKKSACSAAKMPCVEGAHDAPLPPSRTSRSRLVLAFDHFRLAGGFQVHATMREGRRRDQHPSSLRRGTGVSSPLRLRLRRQLLPMQPIILSFLSRQLGLHGFLIGVVVSEGRMNLRVRRYGRSDGKSPRASTPAYTSPRCARRKPPFRRSADNRRRCRGSA